MSIFTGSAVAIVTPFKKDGSVDYDKFRDVYDFINRKLFTRSYCTKSSIKKCAF